jgi:SM-20-related protein
VDASEILVLDRLVPKGLRVRIGTLLRGAIWQYGWKSDSDRDAYGYWHVAFSGGDDRSRTSCEKQLAAQPDFCAINDLWRCLKHGHLAGHEPLRVYANGHTFGVEGYVHVDNADPHNYFTTLYYAHPEWRQNWAGELVFYDPKSDGDTIGVVYPKPGRVVTFHGNLPHVARAPSRECPVLRISVAIKTQIAHRASRKTSRTSRAVGRRLRAS